MTCARPIEAAVLADYWLGLLAGPDESAVEEHLLDCDRCGSRLREVMALVGGIQSIAREGSLRVVVSDVLVRRAAADGLRVREYAPLPGGSVRCTVAADDDLLVARLAADLSAARRVDLCLSDERGVEQGRMRDIPFHPGAAHVVFQEGIAFMKTAPDLVLVARLISVDDTGGERLLGEYTFRHTRTMPGPGAW